MQKDPKYTLTDFSTEEGKLISADLDAVLVKYNGQFVVTPFINPNGTLAAKVELFKKVELVPKEGIESPYAETKPDTAAEEGSEGGVAEPA